MLAPGWARTFRSFGAFDCFRDRFYEGFVLNGTKRLTD
jgi:hypothetical protein